MPRRPFLEGHFSRLHRRTAQNEIQAEAGIAAGGGGGGVRDLGFRV